MSKIDDVLDALGALHPKLIDLGLGRTFEILEVLGNPQDHLPPVIHIAGTNGKGSTTAFLRALANEAGLKCHVYTSPHLCRFHERIRLADQLIDDETLIALLEEVRDRNADKPITFFEVTTAAAFLAFSRVAADLVILETGLGGLLDSTNVITQPAATIITPVARDHEHFLGSDITEIGRTKAGIFKQNSPAFIAHQSQDAAAGIAEMAEEKGITNYWMGRDFDVSHNETEMTITIADEVYHAPLPSLAGAHQIQNAALAAATLHITAIAPLSQSANGISKARWPGRVQKLETGALVEITNGTPIWLDGAHNAHGAAALVRTMTAISQDKWTIIMGVLNTRPVGDFLAQIAPLADQVIALTIPDQDAALTAEEIAQSAHAIGLKCKTAPDIHHALQDISHHPNILICGSLYLAGHILNENGTLPD